VLSTTIQTFTNYSLCHIIFNWSKKEKLEQKTNYVVLTKTNNTMIKKQNKTKNIQSTLNKSSLGCSLTERTSTKRVVGFIRQASGIELRTSEKDRIDVHMSMTSLFASMNVLTSLQHSIRVNILLCLFIISLY
jgi:hypothetical protein